MSLNIDNLGGDDDNDGGEGNAKLLQMQIAELEVEILTTKHALLRTQHAQHVQSFGNAFAKRDVILWSYSSKQRSRRRRISKEQQDEVFVREQRSKKMYIVKVNMKGNPCDQNLSLWLICLRGHSHDINFSENNYNAYKTSML